MSQIHGVAGRIHRADSRVALTACAIVALAATAACGGQGPAPQVTPHVSASKGSGRLQDEPAGQILLKAEAATTALRSVAETGQPYLLAFALQGGDYLNFSGFNQAVPITAPATCPPGQPALSPGTAAIIC